MGLYVIHAFIEEIHRIEFLVVEGFHCSFVPIIEMVGNCFRDCQNRKTKKGHLIFPAKPSSANSLINSRQRILHDIFLVRYLDFSEPRINDFC